MTELTKNKICSVVVDEYHGNDETVIGIEME